MKAYSSGPKDSRKTYYKCPVNGCDATGIKVRDPKRMPSEPMACPRCAVRGKTVYCERDGDLKGREFKSGRPQKRPEFQIVLVCPECGWIASPMTDPRLADMRPRREERYGER